MNANETTNHVQISTVPKDQLPFRVDISKNAKGDIQYTVQSSADSMQEAMKHARAAVAELELTYPRFI